MKKISDKVILGIDPGTSVMGYGIIQIAGGTMLLIQYGVIHLNKYKDPYVKLSKVYERVVQLIEEYHPDDLAIEAPFFGKNVQSMLKLGRAQGVAIAAAISRQVPIAEYAPKRVKQAVTGNGNASKEQVAAMLLQTLKIEKAPKLLDATDALGVCVCHAFTFSGIRVTGAKTDWKEFVAKNPKRIKE
jgi:crossover junction endodeoxyribonuclease RuvC